MCPVAVELPRVPEPADEADVLREQLDYLLNYPRVHGSCDCPECDRLMRVRSVLLEVFAETDSPRRRKRRALD